MATTVTVGIPTYNNEDTIRETIEQVLDGTRPPDRVLIVDASTDRTTEIIEDVNSKTETPIHWYEQSERGRGVGAARQDIYERFQGDILACLDTNLRVDEEWLENRVNFHKSNPEYQILSASEIDNVDEEVTNPKLGHFFTQANCSITSEGLDMVDGWDPWLHRGEDWDMGIRLWCAGARSYAKSELDGSRMIEETMTFGKWLARPSSVAFLRKYGLWYARYHPTHVLGDISSIVGSIALFVGVTLSFVSPVLGLLSLAVAVGLAFLYLYVKKVPHRDGWLRWSDADEVIRFFLLGYTAIREFKAGDFPWNDTGFPPK